MFSEKYRILDDLIIWEDLDVFFLGGIVKKLIEIIFWWKSCLFLV